MIQELTVEKLKDVYELGKLIKTNFSELYSFDTLVKDSNKTYIYLFNDEVIGFLHVQLMFDEINIINIAVSSKFQNKGYGYKLLEYLIHKYPGKQFFLEVNIKNISAINLYKKIGFETINIRKAYYDGVDALVMQRK